MLSRHPLAAPVPRVKTVAITSSAFLVAISVGSAWLGILFYMRDVYRATATAVGLLAALNSLTYVAGCLLLRPVFRRIRSRDCLLISTGGSLVALTAILLVRSVALTFVLYGMFGLFMAFFWPPLAGWLSHGLESRALGTATARFNLSWSTGNIFSSFLAGRLSDIDPASPLVLSAVVYAVAFCLLLALALLSPSMRRDEHREAPPARGGEADASTPLRFPAWVGLFAAWTAIGLLMNVFPLYAREALGFSKSGIGVLLFFRALFTTAAFLLLGRVTFWHFRVRFMVTGQLVFCLLFALLAVARSPLTIGALLAATGLFGSLAYSSSIFHGMAGSGERARRMGIHEAILSLGMVTGSTAGSQIYQRLSMGMALTGAAVLLLASAATQLVMVAVLRRRPSFTSGSQPPTPRSP